MSLSSDELCASIVRSHRETSQYRVEELQALRWKLFSREEIQTYQNKVYQRDGCFFLAFTLPLYLCDITQLCSLKAKHAISDGLRLRLLMIHQRENWKNVFHHFPPPLLLPLWSHRMLMFNSSLMTFLILKKWPFISTYKYAMIRVDNKI